MKPRLKVSDLNPHVKCTICDGYLVDATTIVECLHAFCRTCIVRYLESNQFCPVCDVQVHKTKSLRSIRTDQTLQNVVYKVVPGLYQNEMRRRRDFYAEHPVPAGNLETFTPEDLGRGEPRFFTARELISLSLQHRPKEGKAPPAHVQDAAIRHLSCPAAFTVAHLKKFVRLKFGLPDTLMVELFYEDELLRDDYALMDVAYIHSWQRVEPMRFFFSVSRPPLPIPALPPSEAVQEAESAETGDRRPTLSEVPRPAYNSVKVDLHDAPHNGFRLKFIHVPDIQQQRPSKKRHKHHHHKPRPRPTPTPPYKEEFEPPPTCVSEELVVNGERSPPVIETEDCKEKPNKDDSHPPSETETCPEPIQQAESRSSTASNNHHPAATVAEEQGPEVREEAMEETTCQDESKEEEGPEGKITTADDKTVNDVQVDEPQKDDKEEESGCEPMMRDVPCHHDVKKEEVSNKEPLSTVNREESLRNAADSISAEFSDDDDLGCQADLVVDEGGKDEEEDLRKKIEAIAEADDEADSGRASDMSCGPASSSRSACEEEVYSPTAPVPPKEEKATSRQQSNKSSIDHVIQQLYLRGCSTVTKPPKEESAGALDLSTTPSGATRKEEHHRARVAVANPVLDTKHRQQTYMPAPKQQHTACVPAPRQPLHHATSSILQAQLTKQPPRPPHSYARPPPPSYGYRFGGGQGMFSNMLPYSSIVGMMRGSTVPLRKDFIHSRMPFAYGSPQPRDVPKQQHPSLRNVCRTSDVSTTIPKQHTSPRDVCRTSDIPLTGSPKQTSVRDVCRTSDGQSMTCSPKQTPFRDVVCRTSDMPMTNSPKQSSQSLTCSPKQQTSLRDVCRTSDIPMPGSSKQTSLRDVCRTSDVSVTGSPKHTSLRDLCMTDVPMTGSSKQTTIRGICGTSDVPVTGIPKQTLPSPSRCLPSPAVSSNHLVHKRSDHYQGGSGDRGGSKYRRTLSGGAQLAVFNPNPNEYSRLVIKKMDGGPIK